jgi:hypothetical protein
MKKFILASTLGLALVSCGGPNVCDCIEMEMTGKIDADSKKECDDLQKEMAPEDALKALGDCV